jgi:putative membrane protein
MHRYFQIGIVSLMVGLGSLGCSGEDGTSVEASGATVRADWNGDPKPDNGKADNGAKRNKNRRLEDSQIVTVLHVVNVGEILEAQFALKRATRSDVRDFASRMVTEHTTVDEMLRALFGDDVASADRATEDKGESAPEANSSPDSEVPFAPSQVSRLFKRQTVLDLQQLRMIAPPEFDLGYITKQVAAHAAVLAVIDQLLLPSVQNQALRQQIEQTRTAVASHLESATAITQAIIGEARKDQAHAEPGKGHAHFD